MAEEKDILEQLKKITESDLFSRSGVNVSMLNLLVKATLTGTKVKEASIGTEIFGKSYDPIKNDTKVRVYVHNLRKKLAEYYSGSGKNDPLVLEIDKGQYTVRFLQAQKSPIRKQIRIILFVTFCLVLMGTCISGYLWWKSNLLENLFWKSYFSKSFPVSVLIGDHFMIEGPIPLEGTGLIRAYNINSEPDFSAYIQQHPENASRFSPNRYSYVTKMGPYCTRTIDNFFNKKGVAFNLKLNSEWDKSKIGSENIIYIGQFKTMGFLRNVFAENNQRITINGGIIEVNDSIDNGIKSYLSSANTPTIDYTLVSRVKGPNKNAIVMFLSDNDIGVISVVNYFTNPDSLAVFCEKNQLSDEPFTALYKVSGWERTGYKMNLVMIDKPVK